VCVCVCVCVLNCSLQLQWNDFQFLQSAASCHSGLADSFCHRGSVGDNIRRAWNIGSDLAANLTGISTGWKLNSVSEIFSVCGDVGKYCWFACCCAVALPVQIEIWVALFLAISLSNMPTHLMNAKEVE